MNAPARFSEDRYGKDIPWLLRLIGCFAINGGRRPNYRFKWGEFAFGWGLSLQYSVYHEEATICICIVWGSLYIKAPMVITQNPDTEDWNASYGFTYFDRAIQFKWRTAVKIFHMPWDWQHVRHDYLNPDGTLHHRSGPREYKCPIETREQHIYTYVRRNGEVQTVIATVNGEEREWRWRWFTWSRWPALVKRTINVDFSSEVGEGSGSWKGGVLGCGWDWKHGEPLLDALRRMERDCRFER